MDEVSSNSVMDSDLTKIKECCVVTIRAHADHNPMMSCQGCKDTIKCFTDAVAFRNYITFCQSRGRKYTIGTVDDYDVVIFRSYEPYGSSAS